MRPPFPLLACPLFFMWGTLGLAPLPHATRGDAGLRTQPETLSELRQAVEGAVLDGLDAEELEDLSLRWEHVLAEAASPGAVASTALVARLLCSEGPPRDVRSLRARAMAELCAIATESGRARRMLVGDFLPRLESLPAPEQAQEVRQYDDLLRGLAAAAAEAPALRAALEYSSIHLRLEVARTWDCVWLDGPERERTLAALDALVATHGALADPSGTTYRERAEVERAEFVRAAFGAQGELGGRDLAGQDLALADARGQVVLLVFWSSWCIPCLEAVPAERELAESFRDQPFSLIGVCADADAAQGSATAARTGMTWPSLHDGPEGDAAGPIARALGVRAWPSAFVFDREGRLRAKFQPTTFRAHWTTAEMADAVRALLEETE